MDFDRKYADELSYMSKLTGQDERLVQAGGGNTSVKPDDRYMLVKASGFQLTDVTADSGYAVTDHRMITDAFRSGITDDSQEQALLSAAHIEGARPSIETFLHSFSCRYTIHTHPLGVTVYASREGGMEELKKMFPEAVIVGYATPGIKLAKKYFAELSGTDHSRRRCIAFFRNHGLLVSADTLDEAIELQSDVINKVDRSLGLGTACIDAGQRLFAALQHVIPGSIAYRVESPAAEEAIKKAGGVWDHAYSPDCVVYCGNRIAVLSDDTEQSIRSYTDRYGTLKAALYGGYLFAVADNMKKARDIACMLDFSAKVYLSGGSDKLLTLDDDERNFLLGWDSEKYRASLK